MVQERRQSEMRRVQARMQMMVQVGEYMETHSFVGLGMTNVQFVRKADGLL